MKVKTALLFFGLVYLQTVSAQVNLVHQQHAVDSLEKMIAGRGDDSVKADLIYQQAYHQYWLDTLAAQDLNDRAGAMSKRISYRHGEFMMIYQRGILLEYARNYEAALFWYQKADTVASNYGLTSDLHDAYASQMNLRFYRGEFVLALDVCHRGIRLAEANRDAKRVANYTNLEGFIYRNMKQDVNAEQSFRKFLVQAESLNDTLLMANACTEMAEVMIAQGKTDSSLHFLKRAELLYHGTNQRHRFAFVEYLRARTFLEAGMNDSAMASAEVAIAKSGFVPSNNYDLARYYITAGEAYFRTDHPAQSVFWLNMGLQTAQSVGHRETIRDSYHLLSQVYAATGKTDSALLFLQKYELLHDSLLNEENLRTIAEMNALYDLEQKDRDLQNLRQQEAANQRTRYLLMGLAALGITIVFLVYNRYRLRQKNALQETVNRQQNELFQKVLSAQEKERQRIAGDLHDGLGSLLSSAKLQMNMQQYDQAAQLIEQSSKDLRTISHAIMPATLTKLGLVPALQQVTGGLEAATQIKFTVIAHGMEQRPPVEKELALYNMLLEMINNAVKHSEAKHVTIQLIRHPDSIHVSVEDDGKGFNAAKSVTGIGLKNIRSRTEFLNGELTIESSPGKGTMLSIDVPVS